MRRWEVAIQLIKENNFKRVAEVGVCKFQTAFPVMKACELDYYIMVDPKFIFAMPSTIIEAQQHREPAYYKGALLIEYQRGILYNMTSEQAAPLIPDGSLDMVIIDALHTEEQVAQDIRLWTPKVRPDGIMMGHDYDSSRHPGVTIAVDAFYGVENVQTVQVKVVKMWIVKV